MLPRSSLIRVILLECNGLSNRSLHLDHHRVLPDQ
jgi:hypothetical protein